MSEQHDDGAVGNEEIENLPVRLIEDPSAVKGGASVTPPPGGPIPIPYPNLKPGVTRSAEPCI
jgi:hypothetical protein